jgi:hypothetical protein
MKMKIKSGSENGKIDCGRRGASINKIEEKRRKDEEKEKQPRNSQILK